VTAVAAETGSNETVVEATVDGDPVEIAFNVRFLVDVLSVIDTPNVALETSASTARASFARWAATTSCTS